MCHLVTGFDIKEIQLSVWGSHPIVGEAWNMAIILMSFTILSNVVIWIYRHPRLKYKLLFYTLFSIPSICLFIVGYFPIKYEALHSIPAFIYFFMYPLIIFVMVFINRMYISYNEWVKHMIICLLMIIVPLLLMSQFKGMGLAEIAHALMVSTWNLMILKKHKNYEQN